MKKSAIILMTLAIFLLTASKTQANQYGPYQGPTTNLSIITDKMVARPVVSQTKGGAVEWEYVDNLGTGDHRFHAGDLVFFKVKIKNTSNTNLDSVTVRDYVPGYVEPFEGNGNFDTNTRVITIDAGNFAIGEEKTFTVNMKVLAADKLPADQGVFCATNRVQAGNDKVSDEDTAQFCIEKEITPVTTVVTTVTTAPTPTKTPVVITTTKVPAAGAPYNILIGIISTVMGVAGFKLRAAKGKLLKKS